MYLVSRGWRVVVYCQGEGSPGIHHDVWEGVERVHIQVPGSGPRSTVDFDWRATRHAAAQGDLCLTLGYNTALFCLLLRARGVPNVINMDGIEWSRGKWGLAAKTWFWLNDWAGCWLGNHLIADHPEIKAHLLKRVPASRVTTIAYGAIAVDSADPAAVQKLGLEPGRYLTVVARAEPENSLLEIVSGFSAARRGLTLAVLGNYASDNPYHCAVRAGASDEVRFLGAIYDKTVVQALRFHAAAYVHGHQAGGTNPSLVEALGAGNAVIAHGNRFNRWVLGDAGRYFSSAAEFSQVLDQLQAAPDELKSMRTLGRKRFEEAFTWPMILGQYEALLRRWLPGPRGAPGAARESNSGRQEH